MHPLSDKSNSGSVLWVDDNGVVKHRTEAELGIFW
jgi:hypothetical protein